MLYVVLQMVPWPCLRAQQHDERNSVMPDERNSVTGDLFAAPTADKISIESKKSALKADLYITNKISMRPFEQWRQRSHEFGGEAKIPQAKLQGKQVEPHVGGGAGPHEDSQDVEKQERHEPRDGHVREGEEATIHGPQEGRVPD